MATSYSALPVHASPCRPRLKAFTRSLRRPAISYVDWVDTGKAGALIVRLWCAASDKFCDAALLSDVALVCRLGLPLLLILWLTAARDTGWSAEKRDEQERVFVSGERGAVVRGSSTLLLDTEARFKQDAQCCLGLFLFGSGGGGEEEEGTVIEGGGDVGETIVWTTSAEGSTTMLCTLMCRSLLWLGGGVCIKAVMLQRIELSLVILVPTIADGSSLSLGVRLARGMELLRPKMIGLLLRLSM